MEKIIEKIIDSNVDILCYIPKNGTLIGYLGIIDLFNGVTFPQVFEKDFGKLVLTLRNHGWRLTVSKENFVILSK